MFIILFGQTGSGKSYIGGVVANYLHGFLWDADTVLPQEMRQAITNGTSFTDAMRDEFTQIGIHKISALQHTHSILIVTMALYKEKNRLQVHQALPNALFIQVVAEPQLIIERIQNRQNWVGVAYSQLIQKNYESPILPHENILNNEEGDQSIINQLRAILRTAALD